MKEKINKILVYIIIALIAVIVFCTVTAFLAKKAQFGLYRHKDPTSVQEISGSKKSELNEFKEFGTLRVLTKSDDPDVSIGENEHFYIDGEDTDKPSRGENGKLTGVNKDNYVNNFKKEGKNEN